MDGSAVQVMEDRLKQVVDKCLGLCLTCCWKRGEPEVVQVQGNSLKGPCTTVKIRCKAVNNATTFERPIPSEAGTCYRKDRAIKRHRDDVERQRKCDEPRPEGVERRKKAR